MIQILLTLEPRDIEDTLTTIVIQKDEVLEKIKSLKISSAAGPDNIHPRILKKTQLEIAGLLKQMFQLSINEGTLPRDWKYGKIVWKIVEGLVPNLSDPITCSFSDRRGRACIVCHSGAGRLGTLKYNS